MEFGNKSGSDLDTGTNIWIWISSEFNNYPVDKISDTICGYPSNSASMIS